MPLVQKLKELPKVLFILKNFKVSRQIFFYGFKKIELLNFNL